ncbi:MAG: hypothetical protein CMA63_02315 [Euryarchaeota archaeon]|nr:hypothetical protein [Euryarchaeota archaeon]|tara:strand:- start:3210 stop:4196 length:987 start_codon:yes stop_codon:yes gene_type:complete
MKTYPWRWWRTLCWATLFLSASLTTYLTSYDVPFVLWFFLFGYVLFNLYIEAMVALSFISPSNSKRSFSSDKWGTHSFLFEGISTHCVHFTQPSPSPLIVILHGWRSTSASVAGRAKWFEQRGWNVIIIELAGHGSSSDVSLWTAIRASEHVENAVRNLTDVFTDSHVSDVFFYGHSIGGFIATRVSNKPEISPFSANLSGLILESPMLLYSRIYEEIFASLRIPSFLRSTHLKRCLRVIRQMHPWFIGDSLDDFDLPQWASPDHPTLCLQSMNDRRLGRAHYDALVATMDGRGLLTHHLLESLPHSGAQTNAEREQHLAVWLKNFNT